MASPEEATRKQRRTPKACDFCHRRGRRCRIASADEIKCLTCIQYDVTCTWNRVSAKRGAKPRSSKALATPCSLNESRHGPRSHVTTLIDNFFESVHPVANLIHEQTFMDDWHRNRIPSGESSYARLMAICALSTGRITSGATFHVRVLDGNFDAGQYLDDAMSTVAGVSDEFMPLQCLQAVSLICLTALESGNRSLLQRYLGLYHGALAHQSFHNEQRWPVDISIIEREERRRLYWYMYRLEVHVSLVLGHTIRCPELHSAVAYPSLPDQDYTEAIYELEWLSGWNFITDVYRGMEHLVSYFRSRRMTVDQRNRRLSTAFLNYYDPLEKIVSPLDQILSKMPKRFTQAVAVSSDIRKNRCIFQVANIVCTYQLLRLLTFAANDGTFHQACRTVLDLIDEISTIPYQIMRAMGLAMLQELSGLGHILSSFINKGLNRSDYQHLRTVMCVIVGTETDRFSIARLLTFCRICMSELLEAMPSCLTAACEASRKLRAYVEDIDRFLRCGQTPDPPAPASALPQEEIGLMDHNDLDDVVIPLEMLEQIPWDWSELYSTF